MVDLGSMTLCQASACGKRERERVERTAFSSKKVMQNLHSLPLAASAAVAHFTIAYSALLDIGAHRVGSVEMNL